MDAAIQWTGLNFAAVKAFASGALGLWNTASGVLPLWEAGYGGVRRLEPGDWVVHEPEGGCGRAVTDEKHHRGLSSRDAAGAPRFARFWYQPGLPFEDELVDALAVRQVLAGIRPSWRRDLEALAEHDSYTAAAQALATTPVTFRSRISKARAAAGELWFAPDIAPGMWGSDRRGGTARPRPVTRCVRTRIRDRQAAAEAA